MCGPRQLFFQCGPETPKGWTPLEDVKIKLLFSSSKTINIEPQGHCLQDK